MNAIEVYRLAQENPEAAREAQDRMNALLTKSATDPGFRSRLLDDPSGAVESFTGTPVPAGVEVRFVENAPGVHTVVLPDPIDLDGELSEEELEAVAGGTDIMVGMAILGSVGMIVASGIIIGNTMQSERQ